MYVGLLMSVIVLDAPHWDWHPAALNLSVAVYVWISAVAVKVWLSSVGRVVRVMGILRRVCEETVCALCFVPVYVCVVVFVCVCVCVCGCVCVCVCV